MNISYPNVTETQEEVTIISNNPLPLGHFVKRVVTSANEVVYSGVLKVTSCHSLTFGRRNYYEIGFKKINDIINVEELI